MFRHKDTEFLWNLPKYIQQFICFFLCTEPKR